MARAQFQKGQKVWVECVGAWAQIEKVQPVWAKGFEEPVSVTYDVGLGREFQATELMLPAEDEAAATPGELAAAAGPQQVAAGRGRARTIPIPGTYPVVVTDPADWGGWRVPGAEYDRDPAPDRVPGPPDRRRAPPDGTGAEAGRYGRRKAPTTPRPRPWPWPVRRAKS